MSEHTNDVEAVFLAALDRPTPQERAAYIEAACAGKPKLLRRVRELLATHEESRGPLDTAPPGLGQTLEAARLRERPGSVIGPYRLLQPIGEGGMGTVFLAEQTEPVRRKVALKIIKQGMDSRQMLARFEAERQALAVMDHPNIARVFDGGATPEGRPYFVMELVNGQPITGYCDEHRLTPRRRLELFVLVCQAVQHAHQKGIIHRDLKPSNVLIALCDGVPVVKVIDFGIAKGAGRQLTERTLVTEFGAVVGTLEYMSLEQAELNNQDVDTRSDIYSLGVLLYELLTGTTPLDRPRLKQASFTELLRMIREVEPARPSARLSESKGLLPSISARLRTAPARLANLLRGELDWIVMTALEKDRTRRYQTANGLAMDVQRFLNDEPVQAYPPSAWYRCRKFARRHKAALAVALTAVLAVLSAVVLLAVSNVMIGRKQQEANNALEAERKAKGELQESVTRERKNYYGYALELARRDWVAGDLENARRRLADCPAELREREWYYLHRACQPEQLRINQRASEVRFHSGGKTLAGVNVTRFLVASEPITLWNTATRKQLPFASRGRCCAIAFRPDGTELVWATSGHVRTLGSQPVGLGLNGLPRSMLPGSRWGFGTWPTGRPPVGSCARTR
jgi:eukaryotic-like serine/threonine-protein kinase